MPLLRVAFSTYADALGSLAVLTLVAATFTAPLVRLIDIGASVLPPGTPAAHPLATYTTKSLVELAFYYPFLALGIGTLALQRRRGEPIRPSRCLHTMLSNFLGLIRLQGSIALIPTLILAAGVAASLRMPETLAITILGLAAVACYGRIVRRTFFPLTMAFCDSTDRRFERLLSGREFALFTLIMLVTWTIRFGLEWAMGCEIGECLFWDGGRPWSRWGDYLILRSGDPLICLFLINLYWRRLATDGSDRREPTPKGHRQEGCADER